MQYTTLGRTGLQISRFCLGTMTFGWSTDEAAAFDIMNAAYDKGINFLDTANIYSAWIDGNQGGESEAMIGKWLQTVDRRSVIIATKVRGRMWEGPNGEGLSRHHIIQAVEDSLRRLQTDYIDLYQTHWPDYETPLEETLSALDSLIQTGKIRYAGCSNHPAWLLTKASWVADIHKITRYDCLQPHYSIFHRREFETELREACADMEIAVIPYSPLAAGFATGKYTRVNRNPETSRGSSSLIQQLIDNEDAYNALDTLKEVSRNYKVPIAQIALAWLLQKPTITAPVVGIRTAAQLSEVVGATNITLTEDEMFNLDNATSMF